MDDANSAPWWKTGVIYQIYPRSYQDSNGDGIGDLAGIRQRLDYLVETLGVDAVWLSPIFRSPMKDFGYDISDYCAIDPIFGNLEDFIDLLADMHARGLRLILDLVPNHTSDQHPWFIEAASRRENSKRDWYVWRDAGPDGCPPNNWLSVFGGSAWEWHEPSRQYYLHSFLKEQPDLNWRNPEVERAMFDVMRFWLDLGVDGFRVDVAHYIMKDPEFRDNPLNADVQGSRAELVQRYDSQVHVMDSRHPDLHFIYRRMRKLLDEYSTNGRDRFAVGEIYLDNWFEWVSYYGEPDAPEFHMPFNFQPLLAEWSAPILARLIGELESSLPDWAWPNYVFGNHDQSRPATRYGARQARVCAVLLLTLRGTPTIYYGDELGMTDVAIPRDRRQDPWQIDTGGPGRDMCRTPMQWNDDVHAGFTSAGAMPWLPLGQDYTKQNAVNEMQDKESDLSLWRRLLRLRKNSSALQSGNLTLLNSGEDNCLAYVRSHETESFLVAANIDPGLKVLKLPEAYLGKAVVSSVMRPTDLLRGDRLTLQPDEATVYRLD